MFEDRGPMYWVKAKDGKMIVTTGKGENKKVTEHDYIVGKVTGLEYAESVYNGEQIKSWKITLKGDTMSAVLGISFSSGFTRSLLNSLANADLTQPVKLGCYINKAGFNSPSVIQGNDVVRWLHQEMPKTEKVKVGSKEVINDEEAVKWTQELVKSIQDKLKPGKLEEVFAEEIVPDDLPFN